MCCGISPEYCFTRNINKVSGGANNHSVAYGHTGVRAKSSSVTNPVCDNGIRADGNVVVSRLMSAARAVADETVGRSGGVV